MSKQGHLQTMNKIFKFIPFMYNTSTKTLKCFMFHVSSKGKSMKYYTFIMSSSNQTQGLGTITQNNIMQIICIKHPTSIMQIKNCHRLYFNQNIRPRDEMIQNLLPLMVDLILIYIHLFSKLSCPLILDVQFFLRHQNIRLCMVRCSNKITIISNLIIQIRSKN